MIVLYLAFWGQRTWEMHFGQTILIGFGQEKQHISAKDHFREGKEGNEMLVMVIGDDFGKKL